MKKATKSLSLTGRAAARRGATAAVLLLAAAAASAGSIPIFPADGGWFYAVPCEIEGITGRCSLDTGARTSAVEATPRTAALPGAGTIRVRPFGRAPIVWPAVKVERFLIGDLIELRGAALARTNEVSGLAGEFLGVAGAPAFAGRDLLFDFSRATIGPLDPSSCPGPESAGRLYPPNSGAARIELDVVLDGETVHAMFDTHAMTVVDRDVAGRHPAVFSDAGAEMVRDVTGGAARAETYVVVAPICMSGVCRQPPSIRAAALSEDAGNGPIRMIIGTEFIDSTRWSFDYSHGRYCAR